MWHFCTMVDLMEMILLLVNSFVYTLYIHRWKSFWLIDNVLVKINDFCSCSFMSSIPTTVTCCLSSLFFPSLFPSLRIFFRDFGLLIMIQNLSLVICASTLGWIKRLPPPFFLTFLTNWISWRKLQSHMVEAIVAQNKCQYG